MKVWSEWAKMFGRKYNAVETYKTQGRRHPDAHHGLHGRNGLRGR